MLTEPKLTLSELTFIDRTIHDENEISLPAFLGGAFGKQVHEEVNKKYGDFRDIKAPFYKHGVVHGSNPFYAVAVNEFFRKNNLPLRTATLKDLERTFESRVLDLKEFYFDPTIVLMEEEAPTKGPLANNLFYELRQRGKIRLPLMFNLHDLDLKSTGKSWNKKLYFCLRDCAKPIYSPILDLKPGEYKFSSGNVNKKTGLPKGLDGGDRAIYVGWHRGLSRLEYSGNSTSLEYGNGGEYNTESLGGTRIASRIVVVKNR